MSIAEKVQLLTQIQDHKCCSASLNFLSSPHQLCWSQDYSWRKVQALSLCIDDILQCLREGNCPLSVSHRRVLSGSVDFLVGHGIRSHLIESLWRSTQKVSSNQPEIALLNHRRLVASLMILHYFASFEPFKPIVYEKHLVDLLLASFQLCHAPIRRKTNTAVMSDSFSPRYDLHSWLNHGSEFFFAHKHLNNVKIIITADFVVAEMNRDREWLLSDFNSFLVSLFQPALIQHLIEIHSHRGPIWLRKICSRYLTERGILEKNGLAHLLVAVSAYFSSDSIDWKQVNNLAALVTCCPSFVNEREYFRNLGEQLSTLLYAKKDRNQFQIVVAILNSLVSTKPDLATEFVATKCFSKLIDVLAGRGTLMSAELDQHLHFVLNAMETLPSDCILFEMFALFLPIYLTVAIFGQGSSSAMTKQATLVISKLLEKLEEGTSFLIAILDPHVRIVSKISSLSPAFDNDGGIAIKSPGNFSPCTDALVSFFTELCTTSYQVGIRIFVILLKKFDELNVQAKLDAQARSEEHVFFCLLVSTLLEILPPLLQKDLLATPELMTEFTVAILQRCISLSKESDLPNALGMLEALVSNASSLSDVSLNRIIKIRPTLDQVKGRLCTRCQDLSSSISKLKTSQISQDDEMYQWFEKWRFASFASFVLLGSDWGATVPTREVPVEGDREIKLEDLVKDTPILRKKHCTSVFGFLSSYGQVKDDLQNPDPAIRGHGFLQLRKLLASRDSDTVEDIDFLVDMCRQAMEEEDSYIYMGAVQAFSAIVEIDSKRQLSKLADVLISSFKYDDRVRVLLAETLARCIPSFGEMMPVYSHMLLEVQRLSCACLALDARYR